MIQWLLDGSALLVGGALLDPASGVLTPLPLTEHSQVAVGTEGRVALLEHAPGALPQVRVLSRGQSGPATSLPEGAPLDGRYVHTLLGADVYVSTSSQETGESRCWWVDGTGVWELSRCLEGGFAAVDRVLPAGEARYVVDSHGEGHPDVALVRWKGQDSQDIELPWEDLYPFGPLTLLPRLDGSFDILTRCPLGAPRPCLLDEGRSAEGEPMRWYRWSPGQAVYLRAQGEAAELLPDPSGPRTATLRGRKLCVSSPDARPACWRIPKKILEASP